MGKAFSAALRTGTNLDLGKFNSDFLKALAETAGGGASSLLDKFKKQQQQLVAARAQMDKEERLMKNKVSELEKNKEDNDEVQKLKDELERKEKIQEKLREMGLCEAGYQWVRVLGGWRCTAGGHFVSDEQIGL